MYPARETDADTIGLEPTFAKDFDVTIVRFAEVLGKRKVDAVLLKRSENADGQASDSGYALQMLQTYAENKQPKKFDQPVQLTSILKAEIGATLRRFNDRMSDLECLQYSLDHYDPERIEQFRILLSETERHFSPRSSFCRALNTSQTTMTRWIDGVNYPTLNKRREFKTKLSQLLDWAMEMLCGQMQILQDLCGASECSYEEFVEAFDNSAPSLRRRRRSGDRHSDKHRGLELVTR